jgi:hypothetical protein
MRYEMLKSKSRCIYLVLEVISAVVMKSSVFWDIKQFSLVAGCYVLVWCIAYSLTLKMEAVCSSKTLVDFDRTAGLYIPEDRILLRYI